MVCAAALVAEAELAMTATTAAAKRVRPGMIILQVDRLHAPSGVGAPGGVPPPANTVRSLEWMQTWITVSSALSGGPNRPKMAACGDLLLPSASAGSLGAGHHARTRCHSPSG